MKNLVKVFLSIVILTGTVFLLYSTTGKIPADSVELHTPGTHLKDQLQIADTAKGYTITIQSIGYTKVINLVYTEEEEALFVDKQKNSIRKPNLADYGTPTITTPINGDPLEIKVNKKFRLHDISLDYYDGYDYDRSYYKSVVLMRFKDGYEKSAFLWIKIQ